MRFMGRSQAFIVSTMSIAISLSSLACDVEALEPIGDAAQSHVRSGALEQAQAPAGAHSAHKPHPSKKPHRKFIYPNPDWRIGDPEDHGLSSERLEDLAELADSYNTSCMVVIHDGVLVGEWYWDGYDADSDLPDVLSTTKTVSNALLGIAQKQGLLDIDDPASDYITAWQGTDSADVTIRDLMVHTSGRAWDFLDDLAMGVQSDQTGYALGFGQVMEPGAYWQYSNMNSQALEAVLEAAVGGDIEEFAQTELFEPLGMSVEMNRDAAGNPLLYRGLSASCRDMARFGYLYMRRGAWKNEQIVPKAWVKESLTPATEFNDAYGYLWWLNKEGHVVEPSVPLRVEYEGRFIASGSESLFAAFGAFAQMIVVDPDDGYVLVRLANVFEPEDLLGIGKINALWSAFETAKLDGEPDASDE